jgi:hypothetical protein
MSTPLPLLLESAPEPIPPQAEDAIGSGPRAFLLLHILVLAMLAGLALSPQLWLSTRDFPLAPVWEGLPAIPFRADWLWYAGLLALLGGILTASRPSPVIFLFASLAVLLALWDQTRWQPWFYQYLGMFLILAFALRRPLSEERVAAGLDACRLLVASIYFWSGLQKLNYTFVHDVHPYLLEPLESTLPDSWWPIAQQAGEYVPYIEAGLGVALLIRPLSFMAVPLILGMHGFILRVLGPWGHDWNSIVWPWNLAMMCFVPILFWQMPPRGWRIIWPARFPFARVTLILFTILPGLNFLGLWDAYLSAALYSGNTLDCQVYVNRDVRDALPVHIRERYVRWTPEPEFLPESTYVVTLSEWVMEELNVPMYPARRVYQNLARALARHTGPEAGVVLIIEEVPDWRTGVRELTREVIAMPE